MRLGPKALAGLGRPSALRPYAPPKGVGAFVWIDGVLYGRVTDDATGEYVTDSLTGDQVYQRVYQ